MPRNHPGHALESATLSGKKYKKQSIRYIKTGKTDSTSTKHTKFLRSAPKKRVFRRRKRPVKKSTVRILLILALMALGSTAVLADGGNKPCYPGIPCAISK